MFCNYCGLPNPDEARFCSRCGKAIRTLSPGENQQMADAPVPNASAAAVQATGTMPAAAAPPPEPATAISGRVLSGHTFPIYSLAFSPDGRWLVSGGLDRAARLWDLSQGTEVRNFTANWIFTSVDISPDGRILAMVSSDEREPVNSISLWDSSNPEQVRNFAGHQGRCFCVRFSRDGGLLASTEGGMSVNLWDVAAGRIINVFKQGLLRSKTYGGAFRGSLAFSPDGRYLATRSWPVTLWDLRTGKEALTFGPDPFSLFSAVFIGFAPDGASLVEVRGNGTIRIWDVAGGKLARTLADPPKRPGVVSAVHCAAMSKDGRHLAVSSYCSTDEPKLRVALWDVPAGRILGTLLPSDGSQALAFTPDGQWLAFTDTIYGGGKASGLIKFQRVSEVR